MNKHARNTDPLTSHLAAQENEGNRASQIKQVVTALKEYDNCTSKELSTWSGLDRYLVARRLSDAEADNQAVRKDSRKCTVSNRLCVTWCAIH